MSDATRARHGSSARSVVGWLLPATIAIGSGLLAGGYAMDGPALWIAGVAFVPAVLWAAARRRHLAPAADVLLIMYVGAAGLGSWLGVGPGWMISAAVAGLVAWDLARLDQRLAESGHVEGRNKLEMRHLVHLLPVVAMGLVLGLVGARARIDLGFLPVLLLGVLVVAGLAGAVAYLVRAQD